MRHLLNRVALVGATVALLLATQAAAGGTTTTTYTVGSTGVPGVDTGLVLKSGRSVGVSATGTVCNGVGYCGGPNGALFSVDTDAGTPAYLLPGAPAYGLVARVGDGPWVQVGSGPKTISGTGVLVFAMNDNYYPDNSGVFTVTVSYGRGAATQGCYPGWGHGDTNHDHGGPPGQGGACFPGNGYGDTNHDHTGPPGQGAQDQNTPGASGEHANAGARGGGR